jgi:hypothetical protein
MSGSLVAVFNMTPHIVLHVIFKKVRPANDYLFSNHTIVRLSALAASWAVLSLPGYAELARLAEQCS